MKCYTTEVPVEYFPHATTAEAVDVILSTLDRVAKVVGYYEILEMLTRDSHGLAYIAPRYEDRISGKEFVVVFPMVAIRSAPPDDVGALHRGIAITAHLRIRNSPYDPTIPVVRGFVAQHHMDSVLKDMQGGMSDVSDIECIKMFQTVQATMVLPVSGVLGAESSSEADGQGESSP
jgi:hypothetical protein